MFPVLRTHCHICSECSAPFQLLLDSGSGKYCVAGQLHLLWQGFQSPGHYLEHPGNVLIPPSTATPFCHQPKVQQLKIEPLLLSLSPGQGICDSTLRQACSISVVSDMSASLPRNPNFRCHCRISMSLGPGCLSAKPLRTDPLEVLVSPGVLHILQHVMSMLALSCLIVSFGINFSKTVF